MSSTARWRRARPLAYWSRVAVDCGRPGGARFRWRFRSPGSVPALHPYTPRPVAAGPAATRDVVRCTRPRRSRGAPLPPDLARTDSSQAISRLHFDRGCWSFRDITLRIRQLPNFVFVRTRPAGTAATPIVRGYGMPGSDPHDARPQRLCGWARCGRPAQVLSCGVPRYASPGRAILATRRSRGAGQQAPPQIFHGVRRWRITGRLRPHCRPTGAWPSPRARQASGGDEYWLTYLLTAKRRKQSIAVPRLVGYNGTQVMQSHWRQMVVGTGVSPVQSRRNYQEDRLPVVFWWARFGGPDGPKASIAEHAARDALLATGCLRQPASRPEVPSATGPDAGVTKSASWVRLRGGTDVQSGLPDLRAGGRRLVPGPARGGSRMASTGPVRPQTTCPAGIPVRGGTAVPELLAMTRRRRARRPLYQRR